ncbi:cell division protein ZipA [Alteromonas sp. BL110]|uniref:cell division protein ZipA n=1 Tax=Alteromonas sp. BL110 TaxID=1714845 RepID=UPI000E490089|nr:cell division protein ZipA [Alteromonas sp. BL110]AXT40432.1 cell division protein ZipA [Alteromonas sp. BL110]RKM79664.1 cell division protein ZipA [Alteromonas sp. BL110]
MEDQLRLFLLLGGTVFIIAVLAHGIWKIRKSGKPSEKERLEPRQWQEDDGELEVEPQEGFDELGIGAVRVVSHSQNESKEPSAVAAAPSSISVDDSLNNEDNGSAPQKFGDDESNHASQYASSSDIQSQKDDASQEHSHANSNDNSSMSPVVKEGGTEGEKGSEKEDAQDAPKLYGSVVTNPKPHMKGQARSFDSATNKSSENVAAFPEPPGFLLREGEDEASSEKQSQREESSQNASDTVQTNEDNGYSDTQTTAQYEQTPAAPVRPAQKFYVDPTLEEEQAPVQAPAKNEREVADFSLDTQEESPSSRVGREEPEQPRRFARSKRNKTPIKKREEPNFGDDQMRIDFDTSEQGTPDFDEEGFSANDKHSDGATGASEPAKSTAVEPEVLVLNVRAPEGEAISGAALLPMLLTLGFKFGDQDIFHRHVNSNGKGPVLFSLANMFKPGVFDIDNLENFETQGVSLFMILPIEGDPHQVFNMMHNAARKLADEFGAQVLDGRRSVLTKQGLQQYVEKIREFERKRMIARS